ncbi:hypothetical protein [Antribacter gilvus]|uniref:hypothetical protein n=1 Tax=Antribacter gilvus TaxID=2304675 RepID=UPI000F795172|nr:hypothetical protein [Antribacter gilvus]
MGKGAYMSVTNNRAEPLTLFVSNQKCMYDHGAEGSNVSYFNNLTVPVASVLPDANGQYVEVKASSTGGDTCASETSSFDVEVNIGTVPLGTIKISERWNQYSGTSTNTDDIKVDVGRGSDQDVIRVTIT